LTRAGYRLPEILPLLNVISVLVPLSPQNHCLPWHGFGLLHVFRTAYFHSHPRVIQDGMNAAGNSARQGGCITSSRPLRWPDRLLIVSWRDSPYPPFHDVCVQQLTIQPLAGCRHVLQPGQDRQPPMPHGQCCRRACQSRSVAKRNGFVNFLELHLSPLRVLVARVIGIGEEVQWSYTEFV
jgi:hypothetical protein